MRYILMGVLLGLLLLFPQLRAVVAVIIAALLSQPLIVAFGLGLVAGLRMRGMRRWAR
ncbi:hypothetical protein [Streptomyces cyaneochromogenes]|uniref:hypothetical protein n=1 Tax=Streptomyces cyaneochromogenes TaxID=2496836 RepID=UPI00158AE71A|nr:hypothetical protein [Streptomyces cyaneochromogenes]